MVLRLLERIFFFDLFVSPPFEYGFRRCHCPPRHGRGRPTWTWKKWALFWLQKDLLWWVIDEISLLPIRINRITSFSVKLRRCSISTKNIQWKKLNISMKLGLIQNYCKRPTEGRNSGARDFVSTFRKEFHTFSRRSLEWHLLVRRDLTYRTYFEHWKSRRE